MNAQPAPPSDHLLAPHVPCVEHTADGWRLSCSCGFLSIGMLQRESAAGMICPVEWALVQSYWRRLRMTEAA